MMSRSLDPDIEPFMNLAVQSHLVSEDHARSLLEQFRNQFVGTSQFGGTITSLTTFLVATQTLTAWQCEKLRHGMHKGFFLDAFKLIDWHKADENESFYFAQDTNNGQIYEIAVTPMSRTTGQRTIYRVVRQVHPSEET